MNYAQIREDRDRLLQSLGYKSYRSYCRSDHWRTRRQQIIDRFGVCFCCNFDSDDEYLTVHHCDYSRLGKEPIKHLIVLCEACHAFVHNLVDDDIVPLAAAHFAAREMNIVDNEHARWVSKRKWVTLKEKWSHVDRNSYRMSRRRWLRLQNIADDE
ncbi:MAG: hypothetical protein M5U25_16155 [Planctomycetota bacterium]|nr:hypothetical protein [Planctomycetota bacterium]